MRGLSNNYLLSGSTFLEEVKTKPSYTLYDLGWFPGVSKHQGTTSIHGELYEVSPETLELLDQLEGTNPANPYEEGLFIRDNVKLETGETALIYKINELEKIKSVSTWIIESGNWREYSEE